MDKYRLRKFADREPSDYLGPARDITLWSGDGLPTRNELTPWIESDRTVLQERIRLNVIGRTVILPLFWKNMDPAVAEALVLLNEPEL